MSIDSETRLELLYREFLKPGDIAIDVGAHGGRHLFPIVECIGATGRAVAIEPHAACAYHLTTEIRERRLNNVELHQAAAGRRPGRSSFSVAVDEVAYSGFRPRTDAPSRYETVEVDVVSLDRLTRRLPRVDYLKIDVEGGEFEVLLGFTQGLRKFRPIVSFECGIRTFGLYSLTADWIFGFWSRMGYRFTDLLGHPMDSTQQFQSSLDRAEVWDYIAYPLPCSLGMRLRMGLTNRAERLGLITVDPPEALRSS